MQIKLGYLYGDCMNIYGDIGNIIALKNRTKKRGIDLQVKYITIGDKLSPGVIDIYFFGGGQDQAQALVSDDLRLSGKGKIIKQDIERGVPLLSICGGYQLLGEYYLPHKGLKLKGIGLFKAFTKASFDRMIGNIVIQLPANSFQLSDMQEKKSNDWRLKVDDYLVGFENHSGKTYLKAGAVPLGKVKKGFGNNGEDKTEGCIYKNAIGCYMHGSLLPKNPILCDFLIKKALEIKYKHSIDLKRLDDNLENLAHQKAIARFG